MSLPVIRTITRVPAKAVIAAAPLPRECLVIKFPAMRNYSRNLLVIVKDQFLNERAIKHEMECLNDILAHVETSQEFCLAHELVNRNRITRDHRQILKESRHRKLRTFRFLINKN